MAGRGASIAVVYDCLFPFTTGGGERLYRSMAEIISRTGRTVDYLTATQWSGPTPELDGVKVVPVTRRLRLYTDEGVRRSVAAASFAWGVFRSLVKRRKAYDAVFVSGLPILNVFAVRAALLGSRTRVVVDYLEVWGYRQWVGYAGRLTGTIAWVLQRAAIALTPIATCHSHLTATQLRRQGLRGHLLLSPGLIESESSHELTLEAASPPYVLYAGRHIPDKRVDALPPAVLLARREVPDLRLVVLGTGPSEREVRNAAVGHEDWIDFKGFVDEDELVSLMAGATCLANPSRREGYGLVVVEAAAHGTPVVLVADDGNAATELVEPGTNGFVATSANAQELSQAILAAVRGGEALRKTTRSWYEEAVRTRTVERTVGQLLNAIDAPGRKAERAVRRGTMPEEGNL